MLGNSKTWTNRILSPQVILLFSQIIEYFHLRPHLYRAIILFRYILQFLINPASFDVILKLDMQYIYYHLPDGSIQNRERCLNPPVQVTPHPIGRSQINFLFTIVIKIPYSRMFQEHIDYARNTYVPAIRTVRNQTTDATYYQVYLHSAFTGSVKAIYHVCVMQTVHLQYNPSFSSSSYMFYLPFNHPVKFRNHIKTSHQQMGKRRGF